MMSRRQRRLIAIGAVGIVLLVVLFGESFVFLLPPRTIERYLVLKTPLGSTEGDVLEWLDRRGVRAKVARVHVPPSPPSDYPLTQVGGEAFIHESIGHYWLPLRTDVEAFYLFDSSGKLTDLRVRKSVDSL